jgi:hypothetical protein
MPVAPSGNQEALLFTNIENFCSFLSLFPFMKKKQCVERAGMIFIPSFVVYFPSFVVYFLSPFHAGDGVAMGKEKGNVFFLNYVETIQCKKEDN